MTTSLLNSRNSGMDVLVVSAQLWQRMSGPSSQWLFGFQLNDLFTSGNAMFHRKTMKMVKAPTKHHAKISQHQFVQADLTNGYPLHYVEQCKPLHGGGFNVRTKGLKRVYFTHPASRQLKQVHLFFTKGFCSLRKGRRCAITWLCGVHISGPVTNFHGCTSQMVQKTWDPLSTISQRGSS